MPEAAQDYVDVSGIEKGAEKMPAMDSPAPSMPSQPPPTKQPDQSELEYQKALHSYWTQAAEITNKRLEAARAAEKAQEDYQKAEAERRPALQQALQQEQAAINQPLPAMPQIPAPSMAPPISKDTAMTMASIGMLIAGLGGFGSKSTGRAMMGAATGMLDGFYKGSYDQAAAAHRQWEDFFNYQMGLYKMQIDQFNARMAQSHLSLENKVEQYKLDMAPFQDAQERAAMAEKTYGDIFKDQAQLIGVMSKMNEANDKVKYDWARLNEQHRHNLATEGQLGTVPGVGAAGVSGEEALKGVDPGTAQIVRQLTEYKIPLPSGFALRSPYWQRILQLATLYDPTFDATQYNVRMRLKQDFTSGKSAQNIRSLNTAVSHLRTLSNAAKELENAPIPLWNQIKNYGFTAIGDPRVTKFNTAATAVESELAAVFKGMGASDQEIKAWRNNINSSQSPSQLKDNINQVIELMGGRLGAITNQFEQGMGKPKDFQILSPQSREILKKLGTDVEALDPKPKTQAEQQKPEVIHGISKSGKPIWKLPNETEWHYE